MKYHISLFIFMLVISGCKDKSVDPKTEKVEEIPALPGWELVWHDEFSQDGMPDANLWKYEWGPNWYNEELQYYTNGRAENVSVQNGLLTLKVNRESFGGRNYTSTRLNSTMGWTYGRMELRARLPKGNALWPALWMYPDKDTYGGWPKSGEIDIMENWSWDVSGIYATVHTEAYNHTIGTQKGGKLKVTQPWAQFYTYAMEWKTNKIDFFVNDSLYFSFANENTNAKWPFNRPFHFILNIAVEKTAPGQEATWQKTSMEIDYVRVYRAK
jgi:beta-glucanase (GH16 family)